MLSGQSRACAGYHFVISKLKNSFLSHVGGNNLVGALSNPPPKNPKGFLIDLNNALTEIIIPKYLKNDSLLLISIKFSVIV